MSQTHHTTTGVPEWTLGWRMKRALSAAGLKVEDMAEYLGMSRSQLSRYLNDKGEPPKRSIVRDWALKCGVPLDWLLYGMEESEGPNRPSGLPNQSVPCLTDRRSKARTLQLALSKAS